MPNMNRVNAIVGPGDDGRYSVYVDNADYPYGIVGTGATAEDAVEDFRYGYREMKEYVESTGAAFVEAVFVFKM